MSEAQGIGQYLSMNLSNGLTGSLQVETSITHRDLL
jgi:hypothetical protein